MEPRRRAAGQPGNRVRGRAAPPVRIVPTTEVTEDPARQMKRIRSGARKYGLTIKTGRLARGSDQRAYSVVDAATGETLSSNVPDLDELRVQLWWVIRQRRRSDQTGESGEAAREECPKCGTVRVGSFRFCRSCGMDFEPSRPSEADVVATSIVPPSVTIPSLDGGTGASSAGAGASAQRPLLGRFQGPVSTAAAARLDAASRVDANAAATYPPDVTEVRRAIAPHSGTAQRIVRASRPAELVLREAVGRRPVLDESPDPVTVDRGPANRTGLLRLLMRLLAAAVVGLILAAIVVVAMTRFAT